MHKHMTIVAVAVVVLACVTDTRADEFGSGVNHFALDFVPISGDTNPASGYGIVNNDYRVGTFEITNDQWDKFAAELGVAVTGDPLEAYDQSPSWTGTNVPTNRVSWYEAAQFVNWLNTSTNHQAAYKFTGTQGTDDYALDIWSTEDADNGTASPATATDTADVDCQGPVISNVQIDASGPMVIVTFDTNESTTAKVRAGTACGGPYIITATDPVLRTMHVIELRYLDPNTNYYLYYVCCYQDHRCEVSF